MFVNSLSSWLFIAFGAYHIYCLVIYFISFFIVPGTGLAAVFINISVENFAGWKFALTFNIIQKSYVAGFIVYVLINLVLVLSSVYIVTHFAPAAAGSGIPEIKGYLNGKLDLCQSAFLRSSKAFSMSSMLTVPSVILMYRS
jgi:H+/Cl- antiporter ClcA